MKRLLLALVVMAFVSTSAFGALICSGTVASNPSCVSGTFTFSNWALSGANASGGPPTPTAATEQVQVNSTATGFTVLVTPTDFANWNLSASNEQFSFVLTYSVASTGLPFLAYQSSVSFSDRTGTGGMSLTKTVSSGSNGTAGADQTTSPSALIAFTSPQTSVNISDNIQAQSGTNGTIVATGFQNFFTDAPEPATLGLLGLGLLGLGYLARRRKKA